LIIFFVIQRIYGTAYRSVRHKLFLWSVGLWSPFFTFSVVCGLLFLRFLWSVVSFFYVFCGLWSVVSFFTFSVVCGLWSPFLLFLLYVVCGLLFYFFCCMWSGFWFLVFSLGLTHSSFNKIRCEIRMLSQVYTSKRNLDIRLFFICATISDEMSNTCGLLCADLRQFVSFFLFISVYLQKMSPSDLDISWIEETERIQNLSEIPTKENCPYIKTCYVYLNMNKCIDDVVYDQITFDDTDTLISREQLLHISDTHKKKTAVSKFLMKDCLLFHIDFDSEQIASFSQCKTEHLKEHTSKCLHHYHCMDTIQIPPSLFVFHSINTLYFIFQEEDSHETKTSLKSILKSDKSKPYSERHKFTKRVKLRLPRGTRKYHG